MNKADSTLTKTCSSCGQQKPLSAFLQLSETQGTVYGNICAACRKAGLDKAAKQDEKEESSKSDTGHKIDSKAKVAGEVDKRQLKQKSEEEYFEEREVDQEQQAEVTEKLDQTKTSERKHRETFLDRRSFLTDKRTPAQRNAEAAQKIAQSEQQIQSQQETARQEQVVKQEEQRKAADLTTPYSGGAQTKFGSEFEKFKAWLGKGSPIVQAAERAAAAKGMQQNKDASKKETPGEHIDKNWGPKGKR